MQLGQSHLHEVLLFVLPVEPLASQGDLVDVLLAQFAQPLFIVLFDQLSDVLLFDEASA